jgi:hypothetical protein
MSSFDIIDFPKSIDYNNNPKKYKPISIIVVSDTHNKYENLDIPDSDILIHCCDFTNKGD